MTAATQKNVIIGGLVALSAVFIFLYIRGRKVFNRELAADVIEKHVGKKLIDRKNENQDTYLFAWWYSISKGMPTFFHNGNVFMTKTGDFRPNS